jgi:hypothetical protein
VILQVNSASWLVAKHPCWLDRTRPSLSQVESQRQLSWTICARLTRLATLSTIVDTCSTSLALCSVFYLCQGAYSSLECFFPPLPYGALLLKGNISSSHQPLRLQVDQTHWPWTLSTLSSIAPTTSDGFLNWRTPIARHAIEQVIVLLVAGTDHGMFTFTTRVHLFTFIGTTNSTGLPLAQYLSF